MKKIILAFDGSNYSEGAFSFVQQLNELQPVLLVGAFLPPAILASLKENTRDIKEPVFSTLAELADSSTVKQNIAHFEKQSQVNGIDYRIHEDYNDLGLSELKKESHYSDLMILGSEVFYEYKDLPESDEYLHEALEYVKCPVLIVPEKFDFPQSIILAYDGSEDSIFAIKQFAYLFPELSSLPVLLVYANKDPKKDFPHRIQLEEWAARHFTDLTLSKLDLDPSVYFNTWLLEKKSSMLVCGSYGRSGLSRIFKKSFVPDIISDHLLPVFIAHK